MNEIQVTTDTRPVLQLLELVDDPQEALAATVRWAVRRTSNPTLAALQGTPRPAVHPFVWSLNEAANERARNYYFAAIARGEIPTDGQRYIRSGRFGESFETGIIPDDDGISAVLGTDFKAATYVVGDEDGSIEQIPGHDRTGWYSFRSVNEFWIDETVNAVEERLPVEIEARL